MSILIKGMTMPRDCIECRFFEKSDEYCYARLVYGSEWGKSTGCPLVEIPPHGRLIDADRLAESGHDVWDEDTECWGYSDKKIAEELTVIEADMDSFIHLFDDEEEEDGMDSFIRILED